MTTSFASLRVLAVMGAGALLAPAALAQNTSPPDTGEDTAAQTTAEGSQANAASVDDETVIVVTAQGRRQQLADVPVAISAVQSLHHLLRNHLPLLFVFWLEAVQRISDNVIYSGAL